VIKLLTTIFPVSIWEIQRLAQEYFIGDRHHRLAKKITAPITIIVVNINFPNTFFI
jgi:hypothetical protein